MNRIRRSDRLLDEEVALQMIDRADYATISCIDDNGELFSIPLSIVRLNQSIYIHGAKAGGKTQLYQGGRKVSIVCVAENQTPQLSTDEFAAIFHNTKALAHQVFTTKYISTICTAKAYLVDNQEEKRLGLKLLCQKYCPKYMSAFDKTADDYLNKLNIYRFDITEIMGKSNK
ncbi:MAG: pyridoxamine 5'-phosphate oxidase family protein [Neisseriaceae bacterium]|nr:pyridoxamine 5'-phosphate oxidase family protein [Neisseriaceae bacterium]